MAPLVPEGSYLPADPCFESIEVLPLDTRYRRRIEAGTNAPASGAARSVRGPINSLSDASRLRALVALRNGPRWATFATLTFPFAVADGREAKRFLNALLARLDRRGVSAYWSLEFHDCGRPHFHLLLSQAVSERDLRAMWATALGRRGYVHVHAEAVRDQDKAIYYAVKAKGDPCRVVPGGFTNPGRFWGLRGPEARPRPLLRVVAPREVVARIWRPLRNLYASYARRLGRRRAKDNGVVGRLLWGMGGESVASAVIRLVEAVAGEMNRNWFRVDGLIFVPGVARRA